MGKETGIAWTDHTFNPWWGCTKVSPGCEHCYAETWANRYGFDVWGPGKPRRTFGDHHWREPLTWNRDAAAAGVRRRVFCASMADVCDVDAPAGDLARLWDLIAATPALDWLLLSKRPERYREILPSPLPWNVWLGTTAEDRLHWDRRVPHLRAVDAAVRFVSGEPLIGGLGLHGRDLDGIDWLILGGESGARARVCALPWISDAVTACRAAGVAPFVKQLGGHPNKRGEPSEWDESLRVRELPSAGATRGEG
jgi:protein gp37